MAFDPIPEYQITSDKIGIKDFADYASEYVVRPPYQRKAVWSTKKKQALIDSLFRRYYIPRLVIRKVRISDTDTRNEVVDGQQRITAVQDFFADAFKMPRSLIDIAPQVVGQNYSQLSSEIRRYIDKNLKFDVDYIHDIGDPTSVEHQVTATELFRLLQEGESLNSMEVAHAQLSSWSRNFIVKFADDQSFDFENYEPLEQNKTRHPFFSILPVNNTRMKHLQLMARFTMLEEGEGTADLKGTAVSEFINRWKRDQGINNEGFEKRVSAQRVIKTLNVLHQTFVEDKAAKDGGVVPELKTEYFIISIYLLVSHLAQHYVIDAAARKALRRFTREFHSRWKNFDERKDLEMLSFTNNRQQSEAEVATRDQIVRLSFFRELEIWSEELVAKDTKRSFSEAQRIQIYRDAGGLCAVCLEEGLSNEEASVPWRKYHADHILPHSKGGRTSLKNGQLLCATHNLQKSDLV